MGIDFILPRGMQSQKIFWSSIDKVYENLPLAKISKMRYSAKFLQKNEYYFKQLLFDHSNSFQRIVHTFQGKKVEIQQNL